MEILTKTFTLLTFGMSVDTLKQRREEIIGKRSVSTVSRTVMCKYKARKHENTQGFALIATIYHCVNDSDKYIERTSSLSMSLQNNKVKINSLFYMVKLTLCTKNEVSDLNYKNIQQGYQNVVWCK